LPEPGSSGPGSPGFVVRRAESVDADRLAPLFDAYRCFYGRQSDSELARRFISDRLGRGESVIYIALTGREAIGFVQLYPSFDSVEASPVWILHDLFVSPSARGAGAGRALMEAAADLARETGACGLGLATAVDNTVAQGLYESLGYVRDRRFFHYFLPLKSQNQRRDD
jgi:ribosomal protein S18 acetylase RimI-like enzyme